MALARRGCGRDAGLGAALTAAEVIEGLGATGDFTVGAKKDLIWAKGDPMKDVGALENDGANIPLVMTDGTIFKDRLTGGAACAGEGAGLAEAGR